MRDLKREPGSTAWFYQRGLEYANVINPARHQLGLPPLSLRTCVDLQRLLFDMDRSVGANQWWSNVTAREALQAARDNPDHPKHPNWRGLRG